MATLAPVAQWIERRFPKTFLLNANTREALVFCSEVLLVAKLATTKTNVILRSRIVLKPSWNRSKGPFLGTLLAIPSRSAAGGERRQV